MKMTFVRSAAVAWLLCTCLGLVARPSDAQEPNPQYSIKEDEPKTGTRIRQDVVTSTRLPLNKSYKQLTPAQREYVNSWYEHVAPGDEPPFPLKGMGAIHDAVHRIQENTGAKGELYLVATVEPDGTVSTVKAYGTAKSEVANLAGAVLLLTKFKPAVCGGRPCRMDFPVKYRFTIVESPDLAIVR